MKAGVWLGRACSVRQLRSWSKSFSAAGLRALASCEPTFAEDEALGEDGAPGFWVRESVRDLFLVEEVSVMLVRSQTVSRVASSGVRPSWVMVTLR